jgi:ABC-2 type transport system permease protein
MPLWGKIIASISPLTYFTDIVRFSIQQDNYYSIGTDFLALFIFVLLFYVLSIKLHKIGMPKRI